MSNKNYELYRKNKVDIFNMIYDTLERSPTPPTLFPEWATKEEKEQYEKELEEFAKQEKSKIYEKLKDMGFQMNPIK
jgi:hypothetical protein